MRTLDNKKILLVHPLGYEPSRASRDISRITSIMPPLGLAGISAYLGTHGVESAIVDCYTRPGRSEGLIREYLLTERPAFIGLSTVTSNFLDGVRLARMAKSVLPGVKTVFGGAHASALKERVLEEFPEVDFAVVGEGERVMLELSEGGGENAGEIKGLVWRDGDGRGHFNGYRDDLLELDSLPYPAYEKLHGYPHVYKLPIFNYPKAPNASMNSSRGCPYACSYCDRSVFGRSFRFNSAAYMYEHMKHLRDRYRVKHINFYDDQFTFNKRRVNEFCDMMAGKPLGMTFNCAVRAEHVDEGLLRRMKAAGCWMVSLGIESGDEELLSGHRQNVNLAMIEEKVNTMKAAGLRVKGLFMIGLPGETEQSIRKSMDYIARLPLDIFNLAKFTPFPGSPVYEGIREHGSFDEDWPRMDCMNFLFIPRGLTEERLEGLFREFYKSYFRRPRVLMDFVTMAWRSPDSYRRFFLNIGDFLRFAVSNRRMKGQ